MFIQRLVFEEIKKESGPEKRRAIEEVKKRELEGRSGVTHVGYVWAGGGSCEGYPDELVLQSRQKLFEYVCSPEGLKELFGKDGDTQRRLCEDREPDPETCAPKERPGELQVYYKPKEDAPTVPKENVIVVDEAVVIRGGPPGIGPPPPGSGPPGTRPAPPGTRPPGSEEEFFMQHLLFKEIKDEKDPDEQRAAHEAKKWEIEQWPGVVDVEGLLETPQGEECIGSGVSRVLLYVCGPKGLEKVFGGDVDAQRWLCSPNGGGGNNCYPNCNSSIVDRARNLIGGGRSDAGGRASGKDGGKARDKAGGRIAFDAALDGARSAGNGVAAATVADPKTGAKDPGGGSAPSRHEGDRPEGENPEAGERVAKPEPETGKGAADARDDHDEQVTDGRGPGGDPGPAASRTGKKAADDDDPDEAATPDDSGSGGAGFERSGVMEEAANVEPGANNPEIDEEVSDAASSAAGSGGSEIRGSDRSGLGREAAGAGEEDAASGGDALSGDVGDGVLGFLDGSFGGDRNGGPGGETAEFDPASNTAASGLRGIGYASALILGSGALLAAGVFVVRKALLG